MVRWNIHDDNLAKRYHELASNHVRVCLTWLIMDVSNKLLAAYSYSSISDFRASRFFREDRKSHVSLQLFRLFNTYNCVQPGSRQSTS